MLLNKCKLVLAELKEPKHRKQILIWCVVLMVCAFFAHMTLNYPERIYRDYGEEHYQEWGTKAYRLSPGSSLKQSFTARTNLVGHSTNFYLSVLRDMDTSGKLSVTLYNDTKDCAVLENEIIFDEIPSIKGLRDYNVEKKAEQLGDQGQIVSDEKWSYWLESEHRYHWEITNLSDEDPVYFLGNKLVQSGELTIDGEQQTGCINFGASRISLYGPGKFLVLMVLITVCTVMLGLAMVLFTNARTETLYLVLAIGFGIVTLFDITPLYGFDMRFQYDSTYVVANRMMGIEDIVYTPSVAEPDQQWLSYYRRVCDDYSQYQFYHVDEISANYTDMKVALRAPFAAAEEQELVLVETHLNNIGEQLYLYIPQALGFVIARAIGLGMLPMLQLSRVIVYTLFVSVMYYSIYCLPFGKRIYLILALTPTVLVQTVSITRDAVIITMCFFVIAKCLQMAYSEERIRKRDWVAVILASMALAPCKMIYLPVSFFWLLIVYRQYMRDRRFRWGNILLRVFSLSVPILCFFVLMNLPSISNLSQSEKESVYGTASYTVSYLLQNIPEAVFLFFNTMRVEIGYYLNNAIQLWEINLGSSEGVDSIVLLLLIIEGVYVCENRRKVNGLERIFFFLVGLGVFLLTALASMQWTPLGDYFIVGLQGRYLTPVLPLLSMSFINNKIVRIHGNSEAFVKACCCIYPAFVLMNIYIWAIAA